MDEIVSQWHVSTVPINLLIMMLNAVNSMTRLRKASLRLTVTAYLYAHSQQLDATNVLVVGAQIPFLSKQ